MNKQKTLVVITGGTIESYYNPEFGTPYHVPLDHGVEDSVIPKALRKMGLAEGCDFYGMSIKDSKEAPLIPALDALFYSITTHGYDHIVLVHGTDTMPQRAQHLARQVAEWADAQGMNQKHFVFTGGMFPLRDALHQFRGLDAHGDVDPKAWQPRDENDARHRAQNVPGYRAQPCDGWRNLQLALFDVRHCAPGVYIQMGQGLWKANHVVKKVQTESAAPDTKVTHAEFIHTPRKPQDGWMWFH